jgi:co-chaperonin GroES (HSP10)
VATKVIPAADRVLAVDSRNVTEIDGIEMPDNVRQQEMVFGVVIEAGPLASHYKPGDRILYGPYAGKTVVIDGMTFRMLKAETIEAVLKDIAGRKTFWQWWK